MGILLDKAIVFATKVHSGQIRKFDDTPYILHPMEAMTIAGTLTADEEILTATVLHDTVEDTSVTLPELRELFGNRVADLVATETENKREHLPAAETWQIRKEETLAMLRESKDPGTAIMWMSDKLSNMRSFCRGFNIEGDAIWQHFNMKDRQKQEWYYREIAALLKPHHGNTLTWKEYAQRIEYVFGGRRI